ncbi:MAG: acetate--CoA ligase [Rhodospirillales bacterium]|jgi:acetyl-CoA synthetase|nr:acetate--CoA ligase [Rhodospirillales bacterium]
MNPWQAARAELFAGSAGGGNMAEACLDRHVGRGHGDRLAFRFLRRDGTTQDLSYGELAELSSRFANVLAGLGIRPGERVFALLGRVPALYIAALGCLKARAVFSALFASFGPEPVRVRLEQGGARVLITTPGLFERRIAPLGPLPAQLSHVVLVDAPGEKTDFASLLAGASPRFAVPPTAPEDPALLHFTSGTTGAPKAALHVHDALTGHYATAGSALGLEAGDRYWCTADPGWVTGISYGLLAPLSRGAASIIDECDFDPARWYQILSRERVAVWYTAPTAVRMLMKAGADLVRGFDLSALRHAASVGEPLNAAAVDWSREALGRPIHDTWWQSETGAIMIANPAGEEARPGSMGRTLPGLEAAVVRRAGGGVEEVAPGEAGELAVRPGWPSMFRGYLGNDVAYAKCFAGGWYLSGDLVRRDARGWFWFVGRGDDVIHSAGHRIGPFEVESALMEHPAVAEAGVIGRPDPLIGEAVKAFVSVRDGFVADETLRRDLLAFARRRLGAVIAPREIAFSPSLPKTPSGKIMRRVLKAREMGPAEGDLSPLELAPGEGAA